jgi:hypothetical protein
LASAAGGGNGGGAQPSQQPQQRKRPVSDSLTTGIPIASVDEYVPERPIAPPSPEQSMQE